MVRKKSLHDKRVDELVLRPDILGLENIVITAKEVNLLAGKRLISQPDIVCIDRCGDIYVAEYKCNNVHPEKAHVQLRRAEEFMRSRLDLGITKYYVYGNYTVKRI